MLDWRSRFRVPLVGFPRWSSASPDQVLFTSSEDGALKGWAAAADGTGRRVLAESAAGVEHIHADPTGRGLVWWDDVTGDERGRWMLTSFGGATEPLLADAPTAWPEGIGLAPGVVALGLSDEQGYRVAVSRDGGPLTDILTTTDIPVGIGREWENDWNGLSADGALLCVRVASEHNVQHALLRVYDTMSGELVGEQHDPGSHLRVCAWSPLDHRLVLLHELDDLSRPAIWDLASGVRADVKLDLPGEVEVWGWWPDASALLLQHNHLGLSELYGYDIAADRLDLVSAPGGIITMAGVRPGGEVWLRAEGPDHPPRIVRADGSPALRGPVPAVADGRAFDHVVTAAHDGAQIHSMLVTPEGDGPFPTVIRIHGGPEWAHGYEWNPEVQAFADAGYAVVMPNYRGSTGQGRAWREGFYGDVGFAESRDIIAVLDDLITRGLIDPKRVAVEGWSWGGYLSLLLIGTHPDRFAGAIGGIPVADYVACHEDCSPIQQAYDVAVFGATPDEAPETYAERSPITYVQQISSPVLMIAGEADSRCPIRQVRMYETAMREHGKDVTVHTYATGHHAAETDERIAHVQLELDFLARVLG